MFKKLLSLKDDVLVFGAQIVKQKPHAIDGEDAYIINPQIGLIVVADGVGGAQSSDSAKLAKYICQFFNTEIQKINVKDELNTLKLKEIAGKLVLKLRGNPFQKGSSTFTVAVRTERKIYGISVGDSPAMLFDKEGRLKCKSGSTRKFDVVHTEMPMPGQLLGSGKIIGSVNKGVADQFAAFEWDCEPGDKLLVMSDGVADNMSSKELSLILKQNLGKTDSMIMDSIIEKLKRKLKERRSPSPETPWIVEQISWFKQQFNEYLSKFSDYISAAENLLRLPQFKSDHSQHSIFKEVFDKKFFANSRNVRITVDSLLAGEYDDELAQSWKDSTKLTTKPDDCTVACISTPPFAQEESLQRVDDGWATSEGIQAIFKEHEGSTDFIHPETFSVTSPLNLDPRHRQVGLIELNQIIKERLRNQGVFRKPIATVLNTGDRRASGGGAMEQVAGSHWTALVILPPHYVTPRRQRLNNHNYIVHFIDPLGQVSITDQRNLRHFLTQVQGHIELPAEGAVRCLDLSAPLPPNTRFFFNSIQQQHDGIHCGDLSVRNILEIIHTGRPNINPMSRERAAELRRDRFPGITTAPGVDSEGYKALASELSQQLLECEDLQIQFALLASFKRSETVRVSSKLDSGTKPKPKPKSKPATTVDLAPSPSTTKYVNHELFSGYKNNERCRQRLITDLLALVKDKKVDDIYRFLTDIKTLAEQRSDNDKGIFTTCSEFGELLESELLKLHAFLQTQKPQNATIFGILDLISKDFLPGLDVGRSASRGVSEFPVRQKRPSTEVTTKKSSNKKRAATLEKEAKLSEMRLAARSAPADAAYTSIQLREMRNALIVGGMSLKDAQSLDTATLVAICKANKSPRTSRYSDKRKIDGTGAILPRKRQKTPPRPAAIVVESPNFLDGVIRLDHELKEMETSLIGQRLDASQFEGQFDSSRLNTRSPYKNTIKKDTISEEDVGKFVMVVENSHGDRYGAYLAQIQQESDGAIIFKFPSGECYSLVDIKPEVSGVYVYCLSEFDNLGKGDLRTTSFSRC